MKSNCRRFVAIKGCFDDYPKAMGLLNQGVPGYRVLVDRPLLNLSRGDFVFEVDGFAEAETGELLHRLIRKGPVFHLSEPPALPTALPLKDPKVGIFCGKGVTAGHLWHFYPLAKCGLKVVFLTEDDIPTLQGVDVITFPSGGGYREAISREGIAHLRQLIREEGMGYLGTCGGNVFGNQLELLAGELIRSGEGRSYGIPINGYPHMEVTRRHHPAMVSAGSVIRPFYYWGQAYGEVGPGVEVLAAYQDFDDTYSFFGVPYDGNGAERAVSQAGVLAGTYGRGRVILSGPHPEVGEAQVFVDWVLYLAGGRLEAGQQSRAAAPEAERRVPPDFWTRALVKIESLQSLLRPLEKRVRTQWKQRWSRNQTIGLPVQLIFVDTMDRLEGLADTFRYFSQRTETVRLLPATGCGSPGVAGFAASQFFRPDTGYGKCLGLFKRKRTPGTVGPNGFPDPACRLPGILFCIGSKSEKGQPAPGAVGRFISSLEKEGIIMNAPIVIAAFGTTTRALATYTFIDERIKARFPGHEILWAYSSRMVKDFIKQRRNIDLKHPYQVLDELEGKGYPWAVVQSLHLLNGHEFYRLVEESQRPGMRTSMGLPLLSEPEDMEAVVDGIGHCYGNFRDEVAILIGHGTDHPSWTTYLALHHMFRERFGPRVFVSVVEGYPSRDEVITAVKQLGCDTVRLIPFMMVAGTHMKEDIAGGEDSWKDAFEREGVTVKLEEQGLGFNSCIVDLFCDHIREALDVIPERSQKWMLHQQLLAHYRHYVNRLTEGSESLAAVPG